MLQYCECKSKNQAASQRPLLTSYDSGHEYSLEHLIDLRMLVEESAEQAAVKETRDLVGV
jgi:hypothetical protein